MPTSVTVFLLLLSFFFWNNVDETYKTLLVKLRKVNQLKICNTKPDHYLKIDLYNTYVCIYIMM